MFAKNILLIALAAGSLYLAADNNIVTSLPVTQSNNQSSFTLPQDSWVRIEGKLPASVTFDGPGNNDFTVQSRGNSATAFLPAASYTVNAQLASARRIDGWQIQYRCAGDYSRQRPDERPRRNVPL